MSEPGDFVDDSFADPAVLVGVWTDSTQVHRGRNEFTIDFVRHVPEPPRRVLVARTIVAPIVALELRDQLEEVWRGYSEWSMPTEPDSG